MNAIPWADGQFWAVTGLAVVALAFVLRPYFRRRRANEPSCPACPRCESAPQSRWRKR